MVQRPELRRGSKQGALLLLSGGVHPSPYAGGGAQEPAASSIAVHHLCHACEIRLGTAEGY